MRRISGGFKDVAYEEAMELAAEAYDFKTCTYPGGESYGISDDKKCRKAPEGEKAKKEATIQAALKELKSYKPGYQKTGECFVRKVHFGFSQFQ